MANINLTERIDAPLENVFDVFSDFENAAQRVDGIERVEMLTQGPVGKGTRFKETRVMFGRESTEEMELSEFDPNAAYTVSAFSCGAKFDTTFLFRRDGESTVVDIQMKTKALSMFAKLMSPVGALMTGTMKKCIQNDIDQLKQLCESGKA